MSHSIYSLIEDLLSTQQASNTSRSPCPWEAYTRKAQVPGFATYAEVRVSLGGGPAAVLSCGGRPVGRPSAWALSGGAWVGQGPGTFSGFSSCRTFLGQVSVGGRAVGEGGWASSGNAGAPGSGCDLCTGPPGCPSLGRLCRSLTSVVRKPRPTEGRQGGNLS